ncbi:hypothetical protein JX266_004571 [Neoarthrinium moseri]|nr:hypothetical protein JX266_004571 [Neoarthrinium moseri]
MSSESSIILVPWDPDSPEHFERLKQQRIVCGWKVEAVDSWAELQRKGVIGMHWIVLSPTNPLTADRLLKHTTAYPKESIPLRDSSQRILSRAHIPNAELSTFLPIGHISLDSWTSDPDLKTSAANGTYSIMCFYISRVLQNGGLGAAALASCEQMAVVDLGAKTITLNTIGNEECLPNNPRRIAMGKTNIPKPTNEDWYTHRGYKSYFRKNDAWFDTDPTGKKWGVTSAFLRKDLV